jgi:hypothetical protein
MGTDISTILEVRDSDGVWKIPLLSPADDAADDFFPFGIRNNDLFSFLLVGQNWKSDCPTLLEEDRGLPFDSEYLDKPGRDMWWGNTKRQEIKEDSNNFCYSWATLAEMLAFDYAQSPGKKVESRPNFPDFTMRDFLGESYFNQLERLKAYGEPEKVRVIFWFN